MDALTLTGNALNKVEIEYHGKFGSTIGRIQHIAIIIRFDICYTIFRLATQNMSPTLPGFQGIKFCVQYLSSYLHKTIFYPFNYYDN